MPSLRRTVNDLGGSYVEDPMDRIESDNRNANMQASQFNYGTQQNSALTALALARLKQSDYQFGQGRADQMAVFREGLAAQNHATDVNAGLAEKGLAQGAHFFDANNAYRQGVDERNEGHYRDSLNPETNPALKAAIMQNEVLARLAARGEKADVRTDKATDRADAAADSVPVPDFRDDFERDTYKADLGAGMTPAQAAVKVAANRRTQATGAAETMQGDYGSSIDDATSGSLPIIRDLTDMFGDTSGAAVRTALDKRKALRQTLHDAGKSDQEITAILQQIERKHKPSLFPTDDAKKLYAQLGY